MKMENLLKPKFGFIFVFFASFIVYLFTVSRFPVDFADSDELITAGYFLGVPHPPGYPVFNLIIYFFSHLPFVSPAFGANLSSAISQSLTLGFVFLIGFELIKKFQKKSEQKKSDLTIIFVSMIGSLCLGFSFLFWNMANFTEVMGMNNLLASILIWLGIKLNTDDFSISLRSGRNDKIALKSLTTLSSVSSLSNDISKYWVWFFVVLGLGISHHQTFFLILPGVFLMIYPNLLINKKDIAFKISKILKSLDFKKIGFGLFISLVTAILCFSLLVIYRMGNSPVSWNFKNNLNGFIGHILRRDFANVTTEDGTKLGSYFSGFYLPENLKSLQFYLFSEIPNHFGIVGIILILLGIFGLVKKDDFSTSLRSSRNDKLMKNGLVLGFLISGPFLAFYLTHENDLSNPSKYFTSIAITERMYVLSYVFLGIFIILGLDLVRKFLVSQKLQKFIYFAILIPVFFVWQNFRANNLKSYSYSYDYAKNMLESVENGSVIACFSDVSCFSLMYVQNIAKIRTDVFVVPITTQLQNKKAAERFLLNYKDTFFRFVDLISWGMKNKNHIYLAEAKDDYIQKLGLDGQVFYLQPKGYLFKVVCNVSEYKDQNYDFAENLVKYKEDKRQYFIRAFKAILMEQNSKNGVIYARSNEKSLASREFALAQNLHESPEIDKLISGLSAYEGDNNYIEKQSCKESGEFLKKGLECKTDHQCQYQNLFFALLVDPTKIGIREALSLMYKDNGYNELFDKEKENIEILKKFFKNGEEDSKIKLD